MSHWNYRIIKHTEKDGAVWYAIHEAYYDKERAHSVSMLPNSITGDTVKEIEWALEKMIEATKKPILNFEDF